MTPPKVAIVVLNYNGSQFLEKFIPVLIKNSSSNAAHIEFWVIDNASTDLSVDVIKKFPEINLVTLNQNLGFAGGYNEGLKSITSDFYVLINSDVEVTEDWIEPLLNVFFKNESVAAVQPKILSYNEKEFFEYAGAAGGFMDYLGYPFCRGRIFDTVERDHGQYDDCSRIFWASGACIMLRSKIFWEAGGFDPLFFAHMEEIDLCWRIQHLGYEIMVQPKSVVYHVGGGTLHYASPFKTYLNFRNSLFVLVKNHPSRFWWGIIFLRLLLDMPSAFFLSFKAGLGHLMAVLKAHFSFYRHFPAMIHKRRNAKLSPETAQQLQPFSIVWQYFVKRKRTYLDLLSSDVFHTPRSFSKK
jgi:hypothetical protein